MEIRRRYAMYYMDKKFELEKLALERIDKVEDRIIQTNIMFVLGLTFLNAVYGILFKNNFLTLFNETHSIFNFKFTNSISVSSNSNNFWVSITLIILNLIIYYIWYNKIVRYNHIKGHINKLLSNSNFKIKDLLEGKEKNLKAQFLENVLVVLSFFYIAMMPLLHFYTDLSNNITISVYLSIIIFVFIAYLSWLNLSKTKNQRKFSRICLIIFAIMTFLLIIIWFYPKTIVSFLLFIKLPKTVIKKIIETILVTLILAEIIIFLCIIIIPPIWNYAMLLKLLLKIICWFKNLFIKLFLWIKQLIKTITEK